jgi:two-component system cell cycle response regulator DivK
MKPYILVIEDQDDNRRIVRDLLTSAGMAVLEARDGAEGVRMAATMKPDVILMDIQMPIMDGYEATRRIRSAAETKHIPIIVVTSYALSGDDAKAHLAGASAYIAKPFSPRVLLAKIRELLGPA